MPVYGYIICTSYLTCMYVKISIIAQRSCLHETKHSVQGIHINKMHIRKTRQASH